MEIEVEHILAVRTKYNYIIAPEACIGSAPMICDSNISYNKRFICERSVIAGNEISKKNCKFTAKKKKAEETIVMRVGENEFIVSTMGEEVYFHYGK